MKRRISIILAISAIFTISSLSAQDKKITLIQLPYAIDALEPIITKETFEYHWGKHLKGYVDKTNELIAGTPYEKMTLEEIVKKSDGVLFNNAAQIWNHNFFFQGFSPKPKMTPQGQLLNQIKKDFGSVDKLKESFEKTGLGQFGSGWVWLIYKDGKLQIKSTSNAENPLKDGGKILLVADVWEHSYYIDYRNGRAAYLKKLWNIVDWNVIEKRFSCDKKK